MPSICAPPEDAAKFQSPRLDLVSVAWSPMQCGGESLRVIAGYLWDICLGSLWPAWCRQNEDSALRQVPATDVLQNELYNQL